MDFNIIIDNFINFIMIKIIMPEVEKFCNAPTKKEIQKISYLDYYDETSKLIEKYYEKLYTSNQRLHTMIPLKIQPTLDNLYVPLTLEQSDSTDKKVSYTVDFNCDIFEHNNKILIRDSAGMGKTTIIKYLVSTQINIERVKYIPILLNLREFTKDTNIFKKIISLFSIHNDIQNEALEELLRYDDLIIYFDGFDEIDYGDKSIVVKEIRNFIDKYSDIRYVIASRDDPALSEFNDFREFKIKPLKLNEAFQLIKKYDNNGNISDNLIDTISNIANRSLLIDLLKTPLLVAILYQSYKYEQNIPDNRTAFYNNIFSALFNEHDESKNGYTRDRYTTFNFNELKKILCYLSNESKNKVELSMNEFNDIIESISNKLSKEIDPISIQKDLTISIPYFQKIGNQLIWVHKSFKEYFYAIYLMKYDKEHRIKNLFITSDIFRTNYNIIDFCYGYNTREFISSVCVEQINSFIKHFDLLYKELKCINNDPVIVKYLLPLTYYINQITVEDETQDPNFKNTEVFLTQTSNNNRSILVNARYMLISSKLTGKSFSLNFTGTGQNYSYLYEYLLEKNIDIFDVYDRNSLYGECQDYPSQSIQLIEFLYSSHKTSIDTSFLKTLDKLSLLKPFCAFLFNSFPTTNILNYQKAKKFIESIQTQRP